MAFAKLLAVLSALVCLLVATTVPAVDASIMSTHLMHRIARPTQHQQQQSRPRRSCVGNTKAAVIIPGNSLPEEIVVGGLLNFLTIYNALITVRVLSSWVPQSQSWGFMQPVFQLTDPYLNTFRGLGLQFGGIDFSVLPAFFLLSVAQSATGNLGAEIPHGIAPDIHGQAQQLGAWVRGRAGAVQQRLLRNMR